MQRQVQPEILDSLPPDHPDAVHNRRDLRIINALMGNHRWIARTLTGLVRPGERVLEIGSGTGELGRRLHALGLSVDGLDLWPRPAAWPQDRVWHRHDLLAFGGYADYPVVVANLILHQFHEPELAALGARIRDNVRVFVACEPSRSRMSQRLFALFAPLLGANHVSRHDGHVSIAAGFVADELPQLLGLSSADWDIRCTTGGIGACRMIAVRAGNGPGGMSRNA